MVLTSSGSPGVFLFSIFKCSVIVVFSEYRLRLAVERATIYIIALTI